jgi:SAM-dependent methyltransferase
MTSIKPAQSAELIPYNSPLDSNDFVKQETSEKAEEYTLYPTLRLSKEGIFPFEAVLDYNIPENLELEGKVQRFFGKQILGLYRHCQNEKSENNFDCYKPMYFYRIDLKNKNFVWREVEGKPPVERNILFQILKIKILFSETNTIPYVARRQDWEFTIKKNDVQCEETYSLFDEQRIQDNVIPFIYLNGNEFEIGYPPPNQGPFVPTPNWDVWRDVGMALDSDRQRLMHTREIAYGVVQRAFSSICCYFGHRKFSYLDVAGFDGELSLSLLQRCTHIENAYLVDGNQPAVNLAKHRSECDCEFLDLEARRKLKVFPEARDIPSIKDFKEVTNGEQVDVILLCSFVAWGVISREQSKDVLMNCQSALKKDGLVLIVSISNPHFAKEDYEKMGYEVLNMTVPYHEPKKTNPLPEYRAFYVLKKREVDLNRND